MHAQHAVSLAPLLSLRRTGSPSREGGEGRAFGAGEEAAMPPAGPHHNCGRGAGRPDEPCSGEEKRSRRRTGPGVRACPTFSPGGVRTITISCCGRRPLRGDCWQTQVTPAAYLSPRMARVRFSQQWALKEPRERAGSGPGAAVLGGKASGRCQRACARPFFRNGVGVATRPYGKHGT